jgi:hypothetical protein
LLGRTGGGALTILPAAQIVDHYAGALLSKKQRMLSADTAAGTRHDDHSSVEMSHLACLPYYLAPAVWPALIDRWGL